MTKKYTIIFILLVIQAFIGVWLGINGFNFSRIGNDLGFLSKQIPLLDIENMRDRDYPESDINIEQEITSTNNYKEFIVSYSSDNLKIFSLMTVPLGEKPCPEDNQPRVKKCGWPVIIFSHGFINPNQYDTVKNYASYIDEFAKSGFIVLKPDYRGHGNSEGEPEGAFVSSGYTIDVLNLIASVKNIPDADSKRIVMWGHSMGGQVILRSMVVSKEIRAGVIWGGVVASYPELLSYANEHDDWKQRMAIEEGENPNLKTLFDNSDQLLKHPEVLHFIDPSNYLIDISGPIQLHAGLEDKEVPWEFSQSLKNKLDAEKKSVQLFTYEGAEHNFSGETFSLAAQRSIDFFKENIK